MGISTNNPSNKLSISPTVYESKITLFNGSVANTHYGIGVQENIFNFHVPDRNAAFTFNAGGYSAGARDAEVELVRIGYVNNTALGSAKPYMTIGTALNGYQLQLNEDSAAKPGFYGVWTNTSDERIKTDIELADLDLCYNNIKNIPLKRFRFKEGIYTTEQMPDTYGLGFIAQDVQKVFPKAVTSKNMHGLEDCLDLNAGQIQTTLYGCVQKLIQKVESLENEINILKNSNV